MGVGEGTARSSRYKKKPLGSLSDGDDNENGKKTSRFRLAK